MTDSTEISDRELRALVIGVLVEIHEESHTTALDRCPAPGCIQLRDLAAARKAEESLVTIS